jgi:hypothetical protein
VEHISGCLPSERKTSFIVWIYSYCISSPPIEARLGIG